MDHSALVLENARLQELLRQTREQLALVVEEYEVEAAGREEEISRLRAIITTQVTELDTRATSLASDAVASVPYGRDRSLRERAERAEATVAEVEARLAACEARAERDAVDARVALAASTRSASAAHAAAARLRNDVEHAQALYTSQSGVIDMLRAQLADAHETIAESHARRSEAATRTAQALREVEGQVGVLTAAVKTMRNDHREGVHR